MTMVHQQHTHKLHIHSSWIQSLLLVICNFCQPTLTLLVLSNFRLLSHWPPSSLLLNNLSLHKHYWSLFYKLASLWPLPVSSLKFVIAQMLLQFSTLWLVFPKRLHLRLLQPFVSVLFQSQHSRIIRWL